MLPNGHLQYPAGPNLPTSARITQKSSRNVAEVIALENKNWLIYYHYCRREFGICNILIKEELKKSNGMNEFANYIQGVILRQEGKIQESLERFQRCHHLNPRGVDNIKQIARCLFLLGRHKLSLDAFIEAKKTAQNPEWDIYHNLGVCSIATGDLNKGKEYLRQAVQLNRQDKSFKALANIHLLQNDLKGAIEIYNAALEISPDNTDIATSLGLLYMKIGENQKAFEKFGSALAHEPQCPKALLAMGAMLQNHKEYDVALSKYKIASLNIVESPYLWNNIGMCFFGKKKFIAAISCLKKAHYFAPFEWKILYNLGLLHLISKQYASAFHFLSSAVSLHGKAGTLYLALAVTLVHLQDIKNARSAFEQAVKISPNDPVICLNYSVFLYKEGELNRAEEEFRKFHALSQKVGDIDYDVLEIASNLRRRLKETKQSGTSSGCEVTRDGNGENSDRSGGSKSADLPGGSKSGDENTSGDDGGSDVRAARDAGDECSIDGDRETGDVDSELNMGMAPDEV